MTFAAQYRGHCEADCGEPIEVDQLCRYLPGPGKRIAHVICPEPKPEAPVVACPRCFMQLLPSGACPSCD